MKAKFIKGTTLRGLVVNAGDVLDLDDRDYLTFVNQYKDAVPFVEPAPEPIAAAPVSEPIGEKKGKK